MGGSAQPPPPPFVEGVGTKYLRTGRVKYFGAQGIMVKSSQNLVRPPLAAIDFELKSLLH